MPKLIDENSTQKNFVDKIEKKRESRDEEKDSEDGKLNFKKFLRSGWRK